MTFPTGRETWAYHFHSFFLPSALGRSLKWVINGTWNYFQTFSSTRSSEEFLSVNVQMGSILPQSSTPPPPLQEVRGLSEAESTPWKTGVCAWELAMCSGVRGGPSVWILSKPQERTLVRACLSDELGQLLLLPWHGYLATKRRKNWHKDKTLCCTCSASYWTDSSDI